MKVNTSRRGRASPHSGLNLTPVEGLNIGMHYEFKTKLELTNTVATDDNSGIFPDGQKTRADIPAILALGVSYAVIPQLRAHLSYTLTFDKTRFGAWKTPRVQWLTLTTGLC